MIRKIWLKVIICALLSTLPFLQPSLANTSSGSAQLESMNDAEVRQLLLRLLAEDKAVVEEEIAAEEEQSQSAYGYSAAGTGRSAR